MGQFNPMASRRDFVRLSLSGIAVVTGFPAVSRSQDQSAFRLAVLAPAKGQPDPASKGIALGISEARHAATLFRKSVVVVALESRRDADVCDEARQANLHALLCTDPYRVAPLSKACEHTSITFINVLASDDALRTQCSSHTFHVAASDAMTIGAKREAEAEDASVVAMWDRRLERFGASQLNDRFQSVAGTPMTSADWAGWMAVKIAWEAFLRSPVKTSDGLSAFLADDTTSFDGHKGMPLSFRRWDHQLRQPLYATAPGSESVREIPAARGGMSMHELLDTIGGKNPGATCGG